MAMDERLLKVNESKTVVSGKVPLAGNRTRASRVAGENSTTEPPVLALKSPRL